MRHWNAPPDILSMILVESFFFVVFIATSIAIMIGISKGNDFLLNATEEWKKKFFPYGMLNQMGGSAIKYFHMFIAISFLIGSIYIASRILRFIL